MQRLITDVKFLAENTAKYVKTYNYKPLGQIKVSFCWLWPVWASHKFCEFVFGGKVCASGKGCVEGIGLCFWETGLGERVRVSVS